jgi:hypothetical protein
MQEPARASPQGEGEAARTNKTTNQPKIVQTQATQTLPCRNASAPKRETDPPQGQDPALPEQEPETLGPSRSRHPPSRRTLTMPRASEGPERRLTHYRDRTLHCPSRNLRLGGPAGLDPSLTQDPDNAQSQRGTGKPLATSNSRRTLTMPRASEGSEGRPLSRGIPAKTPLLQELPQNPTAIGRSEQKHKNS